MTRVPAPASPGHSSTASRQEAGVGGLHRARHTAAAVGPDSKVVAYCTGGVRSGWVTAVLNDLGIPARIYAGSMWEWAAGDPAERPLVPGH